MIKKDTLAYKLLRKYGIKIPLNIDTRAGAIRWLDYGIAMKKFKLMRLKEDIKETRRWLLRARVIRFLMKHFPRLPLF